MKEETQRQNTQVLSGAYSFCSRPCGCSRSIVFVVVVVVVVFVVVVLIVVAFRGHVKLNEDFSVKMLCWTLS